MKVDKLTVSIVYKLELESTGILQVIPATPTQIYHTFASDRYASFRAGPLKNFDISLVVARPDRMKLPSTTKGRIIKGDYCIHVQIEFGCATSREWYFPIQILL